MQSQMPVYLDYAASTPLDPRVLAAMRLVLESPELFGNPSSTHYYGWRAQEMIEEARQQVADWLHADPKEIIWTSGATEADNLAIKGAAYFYRTKGKHIITVQTEHEAVLESCKQLEHEGFTVTYLRPTATGLLNLDNLRHALRDDTILVSVMQVNNETGVIQDLASVAEIVKSRGALLHVDAAQSAGKTTLNVQEIPADFVSLSAHKVYGPKGIGALYLRRQPRARLKPLLHGGGHEQGLRSGTLATHQIVGMGQAFKFAQEDFLRDQQHAIALNQQLRASLADIPGIIVNSQAEYCVPHILNISCKAVEGESLMLALEAELAVSSGSACTSSHLEASHVLLALGIAQELAHSSIRLSFGRFTTPDEIAHAANILREQLARLRALSIGWE